MITDNRLKHILSVARKAREFASKLRPNDKEFQENMFVIGFLHDIGYEFDGDNHLHAFIGGKILKRLQFKYWEVISLHGNIKEKKMSDELYILNCADMSVKSDGVYVTMAERLDDIKERYGFGSEAYKKAALEVEILRSDPRFAILKI